MKKQKNEPEIQWKYHLHPLIKLGIYILFNFLVFYPDYKLWRPYILGLEILLCIIVRVNIKLLCGFMKFLLYSFIGIFVLFYFAAGTWRGAFFMFLDYALSILTFSLAAFIFLETTPTQELIIGLKKAHLPHTFVFALSISLQFLPIVSKEVRKILMYQKARGYKFSIFHLSPIIIPTILNLMNLSMKISISLKARGFEI